MPATSSGIFNNCVLVRFDSFILGASVEPNELIDTIFHPVTVPTRSKVRVTRALEY